MKLPLLRILFAQFLLLILVSACSTPVVEEPPLLTGVHLQAAFDLPADLAAEAPAQTMDYLLYLPGGYWEDPDAAWPLIFFLHGAGDEDNDSAWVMSYGLPAVLYLDEQPEPFPFVVVSPQAFPNVPWWQGNSLAVLNALLDEVIATYRIDPSRVYLTGLSMGGYGTWFLATEYPERFAAASSISGSGYRSYYVPEADTLCRLAQVPLWAIHGAQDQISAPQMSQLFTLSVDAACEGEVKWTMYPDTGHFDTYERAYRDPELYEWFLAHTKPPA